MNSPVSCAAVICVRNEEVHLRRALCDLIGQGIEVVIIDHGSTDRTASIYQEFLGRGVLWVETLAWEGTYDQTVQLTAKSRVIERLHHDWVLYADADEWMHTTVAGETLLGGISRLAAAGYNAINFEEFVFLPQADKPEPTDCKRELLHYYFFAPRPQRLMRAWKRDSGLSNISTGGHVLVGPDLRLAPETFILRHYIVVSQEQAVRKYATRVFAPGDLARGWHGNRLGLTAERLRLPHPSSLKRVRRWDSVDLDRSAPERLHYWEWPPSPAPSPVLACIYTCDAHRPLLERFYRSEMASALAASGARVIEVYADETLGQSEFDGKRLWVAARELYTELSLKTLRMIQFCADELDFEVLLKIDVTTVMTEMDSPEYAGRRALDPRELADFIRGLGPTVDYAGHLRHVNAGREGAEGWARKKGGSIDYARVFGGDPMPPFFSGKCYALSRRFARYVADHGEAVAREHVRHFMGAEDLMIGRLHQRYALESVERGEHV